MANTRKKVTDSKKKGTRKKRKFTPLAFTKNENFQKGFGLSILFIAILMLIAFVSYFFTGKYDQNLLDVPVTDLDEREIRNWLGKFGASLSQKFIGDWFGLAAFVFIPMLFRWGLRLVFNVNIIKRTTFYKYVLFILLWLPPTLSWIVEKGELLYLGGGIGLTIQSFLMKALGNTGTGLLLFFVPVIFVILNFNIPLHKLPEWLAAGKTAKEDGQNEPVEEKTDESAPHDLALEISEEVKSEEKEEPEEEETPVIAKPATVAPEPEPISLTTEPEVTPAGNESDDKTEFIIEQAEGEKTMSDKDVNDLVKEFGEYDPTLDLPKFQKPGIDLLSDAYSNNNTEIDREELEANKNRIVNTLRNYKIEIASITAKIGPTVTLYEIVPAQGVRISKIKNLEDDIALSLSALGIRIIAPIPGRGTIGIEVPNKNPQIVGMRELIASEKFQNTDMALPIALGRTISNESFIADLAKMPHLLMAGATGQGKSVGINAILVSLLYKLHPSQLKFVLVDPKKVELTLYSKIERHYLAKLPDAAEAIITDTTKVINTLNSLCIEMDQRYELLKDAMVRNIKEYNKKFIQRKLNPEKGHRYLPYIVLVIDEFADLIMTAGKEVETPIARLAQLARAIGIHLIVATQRPSVNVITGIIKANFPARLAFRVTSKIDSRTILDTVGADQLIGRGDMLLSLGSELIRLQCPFVDTPEVEEIIDFIANQQGYSDAFLLPEYVGEASTPGGSMDDVDRDVLFEEAARIIVQHQQGSASLLQRRLKLGYNRAGRIIDQLEAAGIIGPFEGSKARQVLIPDEASLEMLLRGGSSDE